MRCTTVVAQPSDGEPVRGLEPEQAAADHDGALAVRGPVIAAQSSGPRKTWACSAPGIGGTSASRARAEHDAVVGVGVERRRPRVSERGPRRAWSSYQLGGRSVSVSGSAPLASSVESATRS